jgi:uncharacterized protein
MDSTPPPPVPPPLAPPPPAVQPAPPAAAPGLDGRERRLDRKVVTVWRVVGATSSLLPLGLTTGMAFLLLDRLALLVLVVAVVLFAVAVAWYPVAKYGRWRWQLTPLALELRHGVVVRQHEAVPYFRIQQIDITQGPIDRLLHLATLRVTTASASGSAALPGIAAEDAPDVRAELLARATSAVAGHPGDLQDAV